MAATFSEPLRLPPPPNLPLPPVKTSKASRADVRTVKLAKFSADILLSQLQHHIHHIAVPSEAKLRAFAQHLLVSTQVSTPTVILALLYVQRRFSSATIQLESPKCGSLTSSGYGNTGPFVQPCPFLSAYHVLTVGLILSTKFLEDHTHTNRAWADVSGLAARELNIAEWQWLSEIRFDIFVTASGYFAWIHHILASQSDYPAGMLVPLPNLDYLHSCWPSRQVDLSRRRSHDSGLCRNSNSARHPHIVYDTNARRFKMYATPPPSAGLAPTTSYFGNRRHSSAVLQPSGGNANTAAPQAIYPPLKGSHHVPYCARHCLSAPVPHPLLLVRRRDSIEYEMPSKLSRLAAIHKQGQQCRLPRFPGTMYPLAGISED